MKGFLKSLFIASLVIFLSAFSCSKKKTIGEPYILYEIHGTVYGAYYVDNVDTPEEDDMVKVTSPLKGIKVITDDSSEPVYTSKEGKFVAYGRSVPTDVVEVVFEDQDGENNHGTFLKKKQRIQLRQRSEGGDRNYEGYWIATDVQINMFLKTDNLEFDSDLNSPAN